MSHQNLGQLKDHPQLLNTIRNTVGNLICFRIGNEDAQELVKDIFLPDVDQVKDIRRRKLPTFINGVYTTEYDAVWRSLDEIWEMQLRELTNLPDRQFWYKRRGPYLPVKQRTLSLPPIQFTPELHKAVAQLRKTSAERYGLSKPAALATIQARRQQPPIDEADDGVTISEYERLD